jgi:hypothetical protein
MMPAFFNHLASVSIISDASKSADLRDRPTALRMSLAIAEIVSRMRQRLHGVADTDARRVVWEQRGARILIHTHSLDARALEGWLVCNLDVQTDEAGRVTLQFVFFLGTEHDAAPHASSMINAAGLEAAQIADRWGHDLQRVLWDAVLDGIEAALETASIQLSGRRPALAGFFSTRDALLVDVIGGDRDAAV